MAEDFGHDSISPGWNEIDKKRFFVLGPICSLFVRMLVYPPMLIKVRQQVMINNTEFQGFRSAFRHILKTEGVGGLYKGFGPSLLGIPVGQLYLTTYEVMRHQFGEYLPQTKSGMLARDFLAGMTATAAAQTVGVPLDIVTQRLQANVDPKMTNGVVGQMQMAAKMGKEIYKSQGIRGLYSGYLLQMAQFAPGSGLWWLCYNVMVRKGHEKMNLHEGFSLELMGLQTAAAGLSSATVVALTHPIDVVRTRVQVMHGGGGGMQALRTLMNEGGFKALTKGLVSRMLSSVPSSILVLTYYEFVKRSSLKTNIS